MSLVLTRWVLKSVKKEGMALGENCARRGRLLQKVFPIRKRVPSWWGGKMTARRRGPGREP